jgi:hypothetical protein
MTSMSYEAIRSDKGIEFSAGPLLAHVPPGDRNGQPAKNSFGSACVIPLSRFVGFGEVAKSLDYHC